jgi:hypothetical protein
MKDLLRISGIILLVATVWTGCKKDKSADIRDAFVATYSVTETWTENSQLLTKPVFSMSVEKSSQHIDRLLLNNFANYGAGVMAEATVNGKNITIPQQTLPNLKAIIGSGTLSDTTMTFTYTETSNSTSFSVSVSAIKQ